MRSYFRGVKGRIVMAAFIPAIGFLITYVMATLSINRLGESIDTAHNNLIPNIIALAGLRANRLAVNQAILEGSLDSTKLDESIASAEKNLAAYKKSFAEYDTLPNYSPEEEAIFNKYENEVKQLITDMEKAVELFKTKDPTKVTEANKMVLEKLIPAGRVLTPNFTGKLYEAYEAGSHKEREFADELVKAVPRTMLVVILVVALISFASAIYNAHLVNKIISEVTDQLYAASQQVNANVSQLDQAGKDLANASTQTAASIEETVASLEQLTSTVQLGADNAQHAASLSIESRSAAESGAKEIQSLIHSMTRISESSKKIEEIIVVIDDIAFQTNLLALNASVEAARAGEQGKGFAVVADAVRTLAQRSASSAKDISNLIKTTVEEINNGQEVANRGGEMFTNILTSIKKVSDLNNEIAGTAREQSAGIQQISKAMTSLDQGSQTNAATAEEISATTTEIRELSHHSDILSKKLNALIKGENEGIAS